MFEKDVCNVLYSSQPVVQVSCPSGHTVTRQFCKIWIEENESLQ